MINLIGSFFNNIVSLELFYIIALAHNAKVKVLYDNPYGKSRD